MGSLIWRGLCERPADTRTSAGAGVGSAAALSASVEFQRPAGCRSTCDQQIVVVVAADVQILLRVCDCCVIVVVNVITTARSGQRAVLAEGLGVTSL